MTRSPLATLLRFVSFRFDATDVRGFDRRHLAVGLAATWVVGVGRYWDNERVGWLQHAGIGSLVYVVALGTFLYLLGAPLRIPDWTPFRVVCFVTQTAPPAILYALPVELWLSPAGARRANLWFLAVVALWRVVLYALFLRRFARLGASGVTVLLLLPLCVIVAALSLLNLERAVFDVMGGIEETTPADDAYGLLVLLSLLSMVLAPVLAVGYVAMVWVRRKRRS